MAISLRQVAQNCLSLPSTFSVVGDVFGYSAPRQKISLKRQLELVQGSSFGVNLILVGHENFTASDYEEIELAVQFARDIYAKVNLGIRKLEWRIISVSQAGGYTTIDSQSEAQNLTEDWTADNALHDVFVVRAMNGADGWSAVNGSCDKKDDDSMTGSVVSLNGNYSNSGNTFAHEIGHYLGLNHIPDAGNFIGNNGASNSNTGIFDWQGDTMKKHCFIKKGC